MKRGVMKGDSSSGGQRGHRSFRSPSGTLRTCRYCSETGPRDASGENNTGAPPCLCSAAPIDAAGWRGAPRLSAARKWDRNAAGDDGRFSSQTTQTVRPPGWFQGSRRGKHPFHKCHLNSPKQTPAPGKLSLWTVQHRWNHAARSLGRHKFTSQLR